MLIFGIILPKGVYPLKLFLPNSAWERESKVRTLCQISPLWLKKCGPTAPKIAKIDFFGINLPKRGIPLMRFFFTKFGLGKGVPDPHPHAKFHRCGFKYVGLQPPKSRKIVIFGINLPLRKNSGADRKVGYRCTTINLPLCNDIIIVLKITLLHSVSVITNFVGLIPKRKRDKQTKNITLFRLQPARDPRSPPYLAW